MISRANPARLGKDGVWWGPDQGHLWADGGLACLPKAYTYAEAEEYLRRYEEGEYVCSGCQEWLPKPAAFRHFVGTYCEPCAEKYKQKNSRTCRICHSPLYACYC